MSLFKGAGVALITPFNEDNSVNYLTYTKIIKSDVRVLFYYISN